MSSQSDIQERIDSVKNIKQITRAMEMVAAARLRRAEKRIEVLRPYASAIRRMTREAADAAGRVPDLPILEEHDSVSHVGILLVTGDRGLAGSFNSSVIREGMRRAAELRRDGEEPKWWATGRRGISSVTFRGLQLEEGFPGFSEQPSYADARRVAEKLMAAYTDEEVDRVEVIYNQYESPMTQHMQRETLLPLQKADIMGEDDEDEDGEGSEESDTEKRDKRALVEYEPDAEVILGRLVPDYVEISIYRALLDSAASELGARMTAMRSASDNAEEIIDDLTLEMNRARQQEITQELMEVVAGAEALN